MKTYIIYKHTCPEGKSYIGLTTNLEDRNKSHQRIRKGAKMRAFEAAIQKFGWDNFTHTVLCTTTSDDVKRLERQYIQQYNTRVPHGYNMRGGGAGLVVGRRLDPSIPVSTHTENPAPIIRNNFIHKLIAAGVVTKNLRISPKVIENLYSNLILLQTLVQYTNFLTYDASLHERLHCVFQNITHQPRCSCGAVLRMRTTGRYANTFPTHCSNKCTSNDSAVIQKRKDTNLEKYGVATPLLHTKV